MRRRSKTFPLALGAILSALALGALWLSVLAPTGRWGLVAVAGLFPVAAVISLGWQGGLAVWAAAGLLGLLLLPDKLNGLLFVLFFGLYPVVKSFLERKTPRWLSLLGKLAFFNAAAAVLVLAFGGLFLPALPWDLTGRVYLVFLLGSAVFLVYDFGLTKLISFYIQRLGKTLGKYSQ